MFCTRPLFYLFSCRIQRLLGVLYAFEKDGIKETRDHASQRRETLAAVGGF
jgi:hypothetical protein